MQLLKKTMLLMAAIMIFASFSCIAVQADENINVVVNGESIDFSGEQPPVIQKGRILVPFRLVFEEIGADVRWYSDIKLCEAEYGDITVGIIIGDTEVSLNDEFIIESDVPAQIINGRTMVPLRILGESLGTYIEWDPDTKTVYIDSEEYISDEYDYYDDEIFEPKLPFEDPIDFVFSSGVGGWANELTLYNDGTFDGVYYDYNLGEGPYPNGTVYWCEYNGKFGNINKVFDYAYSMTLDELYYEYEPGTDWVEDGRHYIAGEPYGLDGSNRFVFYTPDSPTNGLSEEFLSWSYPYLSGQNKSGKLSDYGIYNVENEYGFFTY